MWRLQDVFHCISRFFPGLPSSGLLGSFTGAECHTAQKKAGRIGEGGREARRRRLGRRRLEARGLESSCKGRAKRPRIEGRGERMEEGGNNARGRREEEVRSLEGGRERELPKSVLELCSRQEEGLRATKRRLS